MSVTLHRLPVPRGRAPRGRRILLFLLLLIVMADAVDLVNPGAFTCGGEAYVAHARGSLAHPARIMAGEVPDPYRTRAIMTQPTEADNVGRRRDPIQSHRRAPRARSHIMSPPEDVSATLPQ